MKIKIISAPPLLMLTCRGLLAQPLPRARETLCLSSKPPPVPLQTAIRIIFAGRFFPLFQWFFSPFSRLSVERDDFVSLPRVDPATKAKGPYPLPFPNSLSFSVFHSLFHSPVGLETNRRLSRASGWLLESLRVYVGSVPFFFFPQQRYFNSVFFHQFVATFFFS